MREGCTPWPEDLAGEYREKGYWAPLTLGDMIEDAARRFGPRVAIISDEGDRITYAEMVRKINRLALHLLDLGLRPGEVLVLQVPNIPEFIYLYFAMQKIGAVPLCCLPAHRFTEISQLAELTDAVGYAVPGEESPFNFLELANQVRDRVSKIRYLFNSGRETVKGFINLLRLLEDPIEERVSRKELDRLRPDPEEVAVFLLSGGTTGLPKVIPRTHTDYIYNSRQSSRMARLDENTVFLVALPIAHNFPLACPGIQGCFLNGARVVLCRSPQTTHVFELVDREKVNHLSLVPALINRCLDAPERKDYSLKSLKTITSGGQKVQPELKVRAERTLGCMVQEVFGMAEGLLCYVRQDDPVEVRHQTAGRPICPDDEIRLVDEEG
ncbi:MAG: AMP-binding protein, partial [Candidatus Tectomicrobia bacterium]|nr:AMP-binding protein [Candidatus Tectomicrobia bacterium]